MPPELFSILIADAQSGCQPSLPPAIERNIASFQAQHPGMAHRLWDGEAIRDFLRSHMEADLLRAYDALLPYAYRADLARLCLLYEIGGVYADLSVFFHAGWPMRPGKLAVFRDRPVIAPWIVSNTVISAAPRFAALETAIRMIVSNCNRRYRGASPLCPTGPVLLGKAIALSCEPQQIHLGEVVNVAGRASTEALVFVDATDGQMIGYRTKTRAGLAELGLQEGVTDYNDFHRARLIYAGDFPVIVGADYLHQHAQYASRFDGIELCHAAAGSGAQTVLLCALPLPFVAGSYRLTLDLTQADAGSVVSLLALANNGNTLLARRDHPVTVAVTSDAPATGRPDLALDLLVSRKDIVLVVLYQGIGDCRLRGLHIALLRLGSPA